MPPLFIKGYLTWLTFVQSVANRGVPQTRPVEGPCIRPTSTVAVREITVRQSAGAGRAGPGRSSSSSSSTAPPPSRPPRPGPQDGPATARPLGRVATLAMVTPGTVAYPRGTKGSPPPNPWHNFLDVFRTSENLFGVILGYATMQWWWLFHVHTNVLCTYVSTIGTCTTKILCRPWRPDEPQSILMARQLITYLGCTGGLWLTRTGAQ